MCARYDDLQRSCSGSPAYLPPNAFLSPPPPLLNTTSRSSNNSISPRNLPRLLIPRARLPLGLIPIAHKRTFGALEVRGEADLARLSGGDGPFLGFAVGDALLERHLRRRADDLDVDARAERDGLRHRAFLGDLDLGARRAAVDARGHNLRRVGRARVHFAVRDVVFAVVVVVFGASREFGWR